MRVLFSDVKTTTRLVYCTVSILRESGSTHSGRQCRVCFLGSEEGCQAYPQTMGLSAEATLSTAEANLIHIAHGVEQPKQARGAEANLLVTPSASCAGPRHATTAQEARTQEACATTERECVHDPAEEARTQESCATATERAREAGAASTPFS